MKFWKKQNAEELKQELLDFEVSQPLIKENPTALNLQDNEVFNVISHGKKLLSTLSIFTGAYLTYTSSLIIFQVFVANLTHISNPLIVFFIFIVGLIFVGLGVGRLEKKSYLRLYLSIPFMSLILGFLFTLAPANWHGKLFGGFSLLFFPLILYVFYYLKEQFTSDEDGLNFL